jgi:hypothetical protein
VLQAHHIKNIALPSKQGDHRGFFKDDKILLPFQVLTANIDVNPLLKFLLCAAPVEIATEGSKSKKRK